MAKVGRNDPCWCGSGKKYKNCHLREDESATSSTLVSNNLVERVHEYALRPELRSDFEKAFESFTGHKLERPDEDDANEMTEFDRAIDYFIHDFHLPDGQRVIERFFTEHGRELPPDQRTRVADWQHSRSSAFDVVSVERNGQIRLRDFVTGDEYPVEHTQATASMIRGEVLVARILRAGEHYELGDVTALRMSSGFSDRVRMFLTEQWRAHEAGHPNSDYEEFLHASGPALHHFLEEEILGEPEGDAADEILDEAEEDWDELGLPFAPRQVQRPQDIAIPILPPPVDQLLTLGEPDGPVDAYDYGKLGIGEEQVPELIRLALDRDLQWAESDAKWAPIHAWRALGQLRAQAAIEPLLDLLRDVDELDDDWVGEDLPQVYGRIGPAAIPPLATYLADRSHGEWARVAATTALGAIAKRYPKARDEVVSLLMRLLEPFDEEPDLSTWLMEELVSLHAVEAAPLIEQAFAAGAIDESVMGDWEDVQVDLGLLSERTTHKQRSPLARMLGIDLPVETKQDKNRKKHKQKRRHKKG